MNTNYQNFEVIIVDNGSKDGSADFIKKEFPRIKLVQLNSNIGVAGGFNAGLAVATGTFVSFLNNDMEVPPDWLQPLVTVLTKDNKLAGCDSKYMNYYERDRFDGTGGAGRFMDMYGNTCIRGNGKVDKKQFEEPKQIFFGLSLLRKDLVKEIGGFDEVFFAYYDDVDLCWRLNRMGFRIEYVPQSRIYHMESESTHSKKGSEKVLKPIFVFHFYKNKLRMLIRNLFGFDLMKAVAVYGFDLFRQIISWLRSGEYCNILLVLKAILWNLRNLRGDLKSRQALTNESTDYKKILLPYAGRWRRRRGPIFP